MTVNANEDPGVRCAVPTDPVDPLDRPLPADWTVERGLGAYLHENGFTLAAYDAPRTDGAVWKIRFSVPNTPRHRWAIMRHDLHHVATGFGTNLSGEGEISAWELRRGIRVVGLYVGAIVLGGALMGLCVAPLRTLRAWRAGAGGKGSLLHDGADYERLLELTIGELRERLGVPAEGLARGRRGLHSFAP